MHKAVGLQAPIEIEPKRCHQYRDIERGVFGAPTFFVGDEMFWGNDRLLFVEAALDRG